MTDEPFDAVLNAARAGADWAWVRIYDGLAPAVLGYLRARGAYDPEAVVGDVFCQLVRDIHGFEGGEAGFRSWVFVIAHHRMLDDARRRQRRPETLVGGPESLTELTDPVDVEREAIRSEQEAHLRGLIDELTPTQRDVLLLRIFGGLTIEEIARAVGRRPGAVKALQRRGLEALRRRLGDPYPTGAAER